jgi:ATP-dependent DNA helicase PIF1
VHQLHENMRVQRLLAQGGANAATDAQQQQSWADYLQRIGEGTEQVFPEVGEEVVLIPEDMCCQGDTIDSLVDEVYNDFGCFRDSQSCNEHIIQRAILTPLNEDVDSINTAIMNRFDFTTPDGTPTQRRTYHSADSVVQGEQRGVYPTEFLNSLNMSGVPPHTLTLQEGCPVILLRNMPGGLANGIRLIVVKLMQHIIDAENATGPDKGRRVFIPRLSITPSDTERMPFTLRRRQFPLRPAFSMTINKAQGQTLQTMGVYLPKPVFCHGQLYVAFSRCGSRQGVRVLVRGGNRVALNGAPTGVYTSNVVYREVL